MVNFWEQDASPKMPTLSEFTPEMRQGIVDVLFFRDDRTPSTSLISTANVIDTLTEEAHQMTSDHQHRLQQMRGELEQSFTTMGESLTKEIEQFKAAALINRIEGRVEEDISGAELQAIEDELAGFRATADFEALPAFVEGRSLLLSTEIEDIQDDAVDQQFDEQKISEEASRQEARRELQQQRFEEILPIAIDLLNTSDSNEIQVGSHLIAFIEDEDHLIIQDETGHLWVSAKLKSGKWHDDGLIPLSGTVVAQFKEEVQQFKLPDLSMEPENQSLETLHKKNDLQID
jgi:hypothetical protein